MRGDKQVSELLNTQLSRELTAISQYCLHARVTQHRGFKRLGAKIREESRGAIKQS